jgi:hypothetical protein
MAAVGRWSDGHPQDQEEVVKSRHDGLGMHSAMDDWYARSRLLLLPIATQSHTTHKPHGQATRGRKDR